MRKTALTLLIFVSTIAVAQKNPAGNETATSVNTSSSTTNTQAATVRLRDLAVGSSRVMQYAFQLTDVNGPRLTGSPGFIKAANWAKAEFAKNGVINSKLESWGEFGKGWQQEYCYVAITRPYYQPLIAVPVAWTGNTPGNKLVNAEVVLINGQETADLSAYAGKLKGKVVMFVSPVKLSPSFTPEATRIKTYDIDSISRMSMKLPENNISRTGFAAKQQFIETSKNATTRRLTDFFAVEKPALVLNIDPNSSDGTVFVHRFSGDKQSTGGPASVIITGDDYLRIQRLVQAGQRVELEADVRNRFFEQDTKGYNLIAEIPGTDPVLRNEIVILGAHLDSWHGATGATDNAAGCAIALEVARLINNLGVKPKRTIRFILWGGNEQGLMGSRSYVNSRVMDIASGQAKSEQATITAYYNIDNGGGKIRGVYLEGNKDMRGMFSTWLMPFADLGANNLISGYGETSDHTPFREAGVPSFQFLQDGLDLPTRTLKSNMDTYDHLMAEDLIQASTVVAAVVLHTAQMDGKIDRVEQKASPGTPFPQQRKMQ